MFIRKSRSTGAGPSALAQERARPDSRRRGAAAAAPAPRQSRGSAPARDHGAMGHRVCGDAGTVRCPGTPYPESSKCSTDVI